ncbi:glycosyltransferase [Kistimonas asteriae]|uniref:glycosyltransferase n=1 Tax=Kistimonas asteriae TaxID=517724 RepID=UPI001BAAC6F6|nr:glycosyltransferase [Kistimonas asteriae]
MDNVVLFIDSLERGGAEGVCVSYANELQNKNHNVVIVVYRKYRKGKHNYISLLNSNIKIIDLKVENGVDALRKLLLDNRVNQWGKVISFNHQITIISLALKFLKNKNIKVISRNVNFLSYDTKLRKGGFKKYVTNYLTKILYKKSDYFIAQCEKMKKDMVLSFHVPESKVAVIYNPVSEKITNTNSTTPDIDILFVGRLVKQKGIDKLVDAIENVIALHQDTVKLVIIGDGELRDYLVGEMELKQNKYTNFSFEHVKSTESVNDYYAAAKVTVLTSIYEGFPNVLIESQTAGTPVVSFNCPSGPSEIINDRVNGRLIENYNTKEFADAVIYYLINNVRVEPHIKRDAQMNKLVEVVNNA